jgi:hypothetical protein
VLSHPLEDVEDIRADTSGAKSGAGGEWREECVVWSSQDVPLLVTHSAVRPAAAC